MEVEGLEDSGSTEVEGLEDSGGAAAAWEEERSLVLPAIGGVSQMTESSDPEASAAEPALTGDLMGAT